MKQNEAKLRRAIKLLNEIYVQEKLKEQRARKRRSNVVLIKFNEKKKL